MIDIAYSLFAFIIMISAIVIVHEWGHYRAGRLFGLIGTHFSLGFGPKIFAWTDKRGTEWRFSPILLGGYVRFPGDDEDQPLEPGQKRLVDLKRWQRAVVVGAGPAINLVLAAFLFALIAGFWGYPTGRPVVLQVVPGSGAQAAGIKIDDRIISVGGHRILVASDVGGQVILFPGQTVPVEIDRAGQRITLDVKIGQSAVVDEDGTQAKIGVLGILMPKAWERAHDPITAITRGVSDGIFMTKAQIITMSQIFSGQRSFMEMSGPIRIARASARTMSMGFMPFLYLMALISIAVGTMNLLPIPGLDGGHLASYAIEGIIRRDIPAPLGERLARAGFVVVACLGIFAVTLDLIALS